MTQRFQLTDKSGESGESEIRQASISNCVFPVERIERTRSGWFGKEKDKEGGRERETKRKTRFVHQVYLVKAESRGAYSAHDWLGLRFVLECNSAFVFKVLWKFLRCMFLRECKRFQRQSKIKVTNWSSGLDLKDEVEKVVLFEC